MTKKENVAKENAKKDKKKYFYRKGNMKKKSELSVKELENELVFGIVPDEDPEDKKSKKKKKANQSAPKKDPAPKKEKASEKKTKKSKKPIPEKAEKKAKKEPVKQAQKRSSAPAPGHAPEKKKEEGKMNAPAILKDAKIKIIPLGGLGEIGKNITLIEYENEIIVIDCGLAFPDEDMPGIDLVIPDISYLVKNKNKIHGILLTHGHEDHIGALPYVLRELNVPVYGTRLTLGIVEEKLKEFKLNSSANLIEVPIGGRVRLGSFEAELVRTNHSIADSVALAIRTPAGLILHTGDFKLDITPIQGEMMDLTRLGELGKEGVLALLSDSTNVERTGFAMSERKVGGSLDATFAKASRKRIIVTTFASNVARVQQVIDVAVRHGRKVAVVGRSMENIINVAMRLGYMFIPSNTIISIDSISNYPPEKLVIITTGSQGEPMSGLYRMAFSEHRKVEITFNDLIVMSSSAIPGNEKLITKVINELFKSGAEVVYDSSDGLHVSGHACQEELKLMMALTKPKIFIPVHGEYRHLKKHAELAKSMGVNVQNIFILENGSTLELSEKGGKIQQSVPSGRVLVDGLGVGDVGSVVLRDRMHLAQDGLLVVVCAVDSYSNLVAGPDIISRGFVYVKESDELMNGIKAVAYKALTPYFGDEGVDWQSMKNDLKDSISAYLFEKTKRRPMILPVITEV